MKKEIDIHLLARVNRVVLSYYAQADKFKTEKNFQSWLATLSEILKPHFQLKGFEQSKNALPFMRFILELNDIDMAEYMKENLSTGDYLAWIYPDSTLIVSKEMNLMDPDDLSHTVTNSKPNLN